MADTGAPHSLPYPVASDPPAGHTQMQSLATQVATRLGFVGKSIVATSEARTNTAFGLMTTPDRVQNVVLPTDGLLEITFQATMKESVLSAGAAAIFLGTNQMKGLYTGSTGPVVQQAMNVAVPVNTDFVVATCPFGLFTASANNSAYTGDVTTGQSLGVYENTSGGIGIGSAVGSAQNLSTVAVFGGTCRVFAAAGTYDVSVRFMSSSGSVTVKNRKLWVQALAF